VPERFFLEMGSTIVGAEVFFGTFSQDCRCRDFFRNLLTCLENIPYHHPKLSFNGSAAESLMYC
jgi:hypothetical protein